MVNGVKNLNNRFISAEIKGVKRTCLVGKGTPQGSVLNPVVWNLAFNELLKIGNEGAGTMVGFGDDACFIISGVDPVTLQLQAQEVIDKAINWGRSIGLSFNAKKTAAILFTHKYKKVYLRSRNSRLMVITSVIPTTGSWPRNYYMWC